MWPIFHWFPLTFLPHKHCTSIINLRPRLSSLPPRKAQNVVKIPLFHYINVRRIQIKELSQRNLLPYGERKPIAAFSSGPYRQGWRCNWRLTRFEQQVRNAASSVCISHSDSHQVVHSRTARSFHFLPIRLVGAVCKCRFVISHLVREIYIKIYTYAFLKKEKKPTKQAKARTLMPWMPLQLDKSIRIKNFPHAQTWPLFALTTASFNLLISKHRSWDRLLFFCFVEVLKENIF